MAIEILMPALSPTMVEGNLAKWLKKEGDKVKPGEIIAEIETDKAIMEVEAVETGILGKCIIPGGTPNVKVNQLIAVLLEEGDDASAIDAIVKKFSDNNTASTSNTATAEVKVQITAAPQMQESPKTSESDTNGRVFASPLAKRIAQIEGINLNNINGSGPHGRIIKQDVENYKPQSTSTVINTPTFGRNPQESTKVPLSTMRKVIAKRLLESKQTIPHFYLTIDCNLDQLLALREQINSSAPEVDGKPQYRVSVNDIMIKATAIALRDTPKVNASYTEDGIIYYNNVDISIAVAIDDGLITPIVKNADQKSLSVISNEIKDLVKRAKVNQLKAEEFQGGGFSVTNLGMFGIKNFHAIVNPPQSAILAIGASEERAIIKDKQIQIANMVTITLSCDHRVVDGALGAELLNKFQRLIENPGLMLV
jgi:pyruvate dehydrogenase E2 component (dihydrolipoamide acetyltransferase)